MKNVMLLSTLLLLFFVSCETAGTDQGTAEVQVDEVSIPAGSPLDGMTVAESQTRSRHGLLIVAVRYAEGKLEFNPGADTVLHSGGSVVVMGKPEDIDRFRSDNQA